MGPPRRSPVLAILGVVGLVPIGALLAWPWVDPRFGYFGDDGLFHGVRVFLLGQLLQRGAWFPRWWPDLYYGYGYPVFTFYPPGVYYLGVALHALGASVDRAMQLIGLATIVVAVCGAYVLGSVTFRHPLAALVTTGAFLLAPYPLQLDLYNRGAFPEALGLALLPWLLTGGHLAVARESRWGVVLLATATAALALTHVLAAALAFGVLIVWLLALWLARPRGARGAGGRRAIAGVALGLGLSAFFWLPAIGEHAAVHGDLGMVLAGDFLFAPQEGPADGHLLYPYDSSGISGPQRPSLGQAVLLAASVLAAAGVAVERRVGSASRLAGARPADVVGASAAVSARAGAHPSARDASIAAAACVLVMLASWFMTTTWSRPVWQAVPALAAFQFPWRFLAPLSFSLAVVIGWLYLWVARRQRQHWVLAGALLTFLAVNGAALRPGANRFLDYATLPSWPARVHGLDGDAFSTGTTTTYGEYLPRSVAIGPPGERARAGLPAYEEWFPSGGWIGGQVWPYAGQADVTQVWQTPWSIATRVAVRGDRPADIALHALVFDGWRATIDGRSAAVRPAPYEPDAHIGHGFAIVSVPPGEHLVQYVLGPTAWQAAGSAVSTMALAGIGVAILICFPLPVRTARAAGAIFVTLGAIGALVVIAFALRRALGPPSAPAPSSAVLAADVLAAVQRGANAQIRAADGTALGGAVAIADQTIAGERRPWLFMHPPSAVEVRVDVPPRAVFQAGLGIDPAVWDRPEAGGVRFTVRADDGTGPRQLFDATLHPRVNAADRGWRFALIDLGAYAGRSTVLELRTEAVDSPSFDWAGWATPAVYVDRSARYPPPTGLSPVPRPYGAP